MNNMNLKQLKDELKNMQLPTSGTKAQLIKRLVQHDQENNYSEHGSMRQENILEVESIEHECNDDEQLLPSTDKPVSSNEMSTELRLLRKEKELNARERELVQKEMDLLNKIKNFEAHNTSSRLTEESVQANTIKKTNYSIKEISDALPIFHPGELMSLS